MANGNTMANLGAFGSFGAFCLAAYAAVIGTISFCSDPREPTEANVRLLHSGLFSADSTLIEVYLFYSGELPSVIDKEAIAVTLQAPDGDIQPAHTEETQDGAVSYWHDPTVEYRVTDPDISVGGLDKAHFRISCDGECSDHYAFLLRVVNGQTLLVQNEP